jgi:hypothetical protein
MGSNPVIEKKWSKNSKEKTDPRKERSFQFLCGRELFSFSAAELLDISAAELFDFSRQRFSIPSF